MNKTLHATAILLSALALAPIAAAQETVAPIIKAVWDNDAAKVEQLIKEGVDVNVDNQDTALLHAIDVESAKCNLKIVKLLLDAKGINVNKYSVKPMGSYSWSRTAIVAAAYRGNVEVVRLLLAKGAKVDLVDTHLPTNEVIGPEPLNTALIYAAEGGFYDIALLLLDKGAKIEQLSAEGRTPLIAAADSRTREDAASKRADNAKVIGLLLERGAKVDSCPLTPTTKYADLDLPAGTPAGVPRKVRIMGAGGVSALMAAASHGFIEGAKVLIDKGAKLEFGGSDDGMTTPLMMAASADQTAMVEYLIDRGAKVEATNVLGLTPLLAAAPGLFYDTVAALLKRGAKVDAAYTTTGATALMLAINNAYPEKEQESLKLMRLLLDKGADVNFQGSGGDTALMYACGWGIVPKSPARAKFLIEKGAKVGLANKKGETALMFAANRGYVDIAKLLLDKGADVNARALDGRSALMNASAATVDLKGTNDDFAQLVKLLLERGADPNLKDAQGNTALSLATQNKRSQAMALLAAKGAKAESAPKTEASASSVVGTWEGLKNQNPYELHRFTFKADGTWTYEAGLSAQFKKEYPGADLQAGYAANIKSQAAAIGTKGKYSFRDQYIVLKADSGFAFEKVMAWKVEGGKLSFNGIEFALSKVGK